MSWTVLWTDNARRSLLDVRDQAEDRRTDAGAGSYDGFLHRLGAGSDFRIWLPSIPASATTPSRRWSSNGTSSPTKSVTLTRMSPFGPYAASASVTRT